MLARILHSNAGSSVAFLHAHMAMRPAAKQGHAQLLEEQGYAQLSPYAVEMCTDVHNIAGCVSSFRGYTRQNPRKPGALLG